MKPEPGVQGRLKNGFNLNLEARSSTKVTTAQISFPASPIAFATARF